MNFKYTMGQTVYYIESSSRFCKKVPCPMCFGKRCVEIILGDDSRQKTECGFCQSGIDRASGTATVWEPEAVTRCGVVSGLNIDNGNTYSVGYRNIKEHELYSSNEDAENDRLVEFDRMKERSEKWFKDSFVNCTKKQVWSAGYHRNCIKSSRLNIEWHEDRLLIIKEEKLSKKEKAE